MAAIASLLARAALEVRKRAPAASCVGLEPDELVQLADRLGALARYAPAQVHAALRALAGSFGDERDAWVAISPAFVELMDVVRGRG